MHVDRYRDVVTIAHRAGSPYLLAGWEAHADEVGARLEILLPPAGQLDQTRFDSRFEVDASHIYHRGQFTYLGTTLMAEAQVEVAVHVSTSCSHTSRSDVNGGSTMTSCWRSRYSRPVNVA